MEKPTASSLNWIYPIVSLASLVIFGVGLYLVLLNPHEWTMLAAGCVSLVAIGVTWPIAYSLRNSCTVQADTQQLSQRLNERVEQMATLMSRIGESQLLSDRAKSVAFREKDRDAIRRAIHEEMERQEWEAAHALADQFEQAFGSKTEADRFRAEINEKRQEGTRKQIAEVVAVIDRHTRAE